LSKFTSKKPVDTAGHIEIEKTRQKLDDDYEKQCIVNQIDNWKSKQIESIEFDLQQSDIDNLNKSITVKPRVVFSNPDKKVLTGKQGEILVLGYYINEFLELSAKNQKKGIKKVIKTLIESDLIKLDDTEKKYYKNIGDKCCKHIVENNNNLLRRELIDLFYFTKKFSKSSFDLIVYHNDSPKLVEVKATDCDSKQFKVSKNEIETALSGIDYELVRVTPNEIVFLGNIFKKAADKLNVIVSKNIEIKPDGYLIQLVNN
jgi:hypothetical protein